MRVFGQMCVVYSDLVKLVYSTTRIWPSKKCGLPAEEVKMMTLLYSFNFYSLITNRVQWQGMKFTREEVVLKRAGCRGVYPNGLFN
jgi:predicted membrane-bound spermidine synthase